MKNDDFMGFQNEDLMTTEILVRFRTDDEMKNKDLVRLNKKN